MQNLIIGVIGGIIINILYRRFNIHDRVDNKSIESIEDKKILLYDAPVKKGRQCTCDTQFCTCGKHVI